MSETSKNKWLGRLHHAAAAAAAVGAGLWDVAFGVAVVGAAAAAAVGTAAVGVGVGIVGAAVGFGAAAAAAAAVKSLTEKFSRGIDRAEQKKWNKGGVGLLVAFSLASGLVAGKFAIDRLEKDAVSRAENPHVSSANQSGFNQAVSVSDLTQRVA